MTDGTKGCNKKSVVGSYHRSSTLIYLVIVLMVSLPLVQNISVHKSGEGMIYTEVFQVGAGNTGSRDPPNIDATICKWYENKSAALSLTYDSGLASHADLAAPLMSERGIDGTFFVTIDNVGIGYGAEWEEWQNISETGHEIGSMSVSFPHLTTLGPQELHNEIYWSKQSVEENLTGVKCESFSYPYGEYNSSVITEVEKYYISARTTGYNISGPPTPESAYPSSMYKIIPCSFKEEHTPEEMNQLIEDAKNSSGWLVERISTIEGSRADPLNLTNFTIHLDDIVSNMDSVWVAPFSQISKYIIARNVTTPNFNDIEEEEFSIRLDSPLDPDIINVNMSVNISLPDDWVDLRIQYDQFNYTLETGDGGEGRFVILNIPLNKSVKILRENIHPVLRIPSDDQYDQVCFYPVKGNSSTFFRFAVNYSSVLNRSPRAPPICIFDFNGDGDSNDTINNISEGSYPMERMYPEDLSYYNGCLFYLEFSFPAGSKPYFSVHVQDSKGLTALDPDGITSIGRGPIINDPPEKPKNLTLSSYHELSPHFFWSASVDPDGDPIIYHISVENFIGTWGWKANTTSLNLSLNTSLEFDIPFNVSLYAEDSEGGKSLDAKLTFTLRNQPPGMISKFDFKLPFPLMPEFSFTPATDPDLDEIRCYFGLLEGEGPNYTTIISRQELNQAHYRMNTNLSDHSFYTLTLWAEDHFGLAGSEYIHSFYLNRAPLPVSGLLVEDLKDSENGLNISWTPLNESDIVHYRLYKFSEAVSDIEEYEPVAIIDKKTHYADLDVFDGLTYYYSVVGVDGDGEMDLLNFTQVSGVPVDDLAPALISGLKVNDHLNGSGSLEISWDACQDSRFQGYHVYRAGTLLNSTADISPVHTTLNGKIQNTFWIDDNVSDNFRYYYAVAAFDEAGNEFQVGLHWIGGISINDTDMFPENDDADGEKDEGAKKSSSLIPIALVVGAICIIVIIIILVVIMKKSSKERDEEDITEPETEPSDEEDEEKRHEEYEKVYGGIGKAKRKSGGKAALHREELERFKQRRKERKERKKTGNRNTVKHENNKRKPHDESSEEYDFDIEMEFDGKGWGISKELKEEGDNWIWLDEEEE